MALAGYWMIGTHAQAPIAPHGWPVPSRQNRFVQHWLCIVQLWPTEVQAVIWQVPLTMPAAITQVVPVQQSALAVHVAPAGWHTRAGPQVPALQIIEQHCVFAVHMPPFATHMPASGGVPPSPGPS